MHGTDHSLTAGTCIEAKRVESGVDDLFEPVARLAPTNIAAYAGPERIPPVSHEELMQALEQTAAEGNTDISYPAPQSQIESTRTGGLSLNAATSTHSGVCGQTPLADMTSLAVPLSVQQPARMNAPGRLSSFGTRTNVSAARHVPCPSQSRSL